LVVGEGEVVGMWMLKEVVIVWVGMHRVVASFYSMSRARWRM
jgi:hypothetical protein